MSSLAPPIQIRRATAADDATIRTLVRRERLDPTSLHWQNFLVAADEGGRVVGIGQIKPLLGASELGSLVVVPEWREKGVGAALIHALMDQTEEPLYLLCRDTRAPYYRKFGFVEIGLRDAPWAIRAKLLAGRLLRLLGARVVAMRRGIDD